MIPRRLVILGVHRVIEIRYRRPRFLSVVRHRRRLRRLCVSKQGNGQMHPACEITRNQNTCPVGRLGWCCLFLRVEPADGHVDADMRPKTGWAASMKQIFLHHGFPPKTLPPEFQARGKKCANPILL